MVDPEIFSATQSEIPAANLPPSIAQALTELSQNRYVKKPRALHWNDHFIAFAFVVEVDLPFRGPVGLIDIRSEEPIIFLCHKRLYPNKVPGIYADRKDFPRNLPHLNPTDKTRPRSICLHRGNLDDWFTEHGIGDLVNRCRSWLRDAARNRLIRTADRFEPTRLEKTFGIMIYPYKTAVSTIQDLWIQNPGPGWSPVVIKLAGAKSSDPVSSGEQYALSWGGTALPESNIEECANLCRKINSLAKEDLSLDKHTLGLLLCPPKNVVHTEYFGELPNNFADLVQWANSIGVPLNDYLKKFMILHGQILNGIPGFMPILRPQPLIGKDTSIEILTFVILASDEKCNTDDEVIPAAPVSWLSHRTPLNVSSARHLSRREDISPLPQAMIFGCGALGSKIAVSLGRSGEHGLTLVDKDSLSPHNLIRHALFRDSIGTNKAEAVRKAIANCFEGGLESTMIRALPQDAREILAAGPEGALNGHGLVIDCTASAAVLASEIYASLPFGTRVFRGEISDFGNLGFWYLEGPNRSPRVDDLQMLLFSFGVTNDYVKSWLEKHRKEREALVGPAFEEISVGVSCSSETLRLADDLISFHAANMTLSLRNLPENGKIGLSHWDSKDRKAGQIECIAVGPTIFLKPIECIDWEIRFLAPAVSTLQNMAPTGGKSETGGILLGHIHFKRRIIYITGVIGPPADSIKRPYAFVRGISDIPEEVSAVRNATGGIIDYVGEWHTHPNGVGELSSQDLSAAHDLRKILDPVSIPTLLVVVTPPHGVTPHLFIPNRTS